MWSYARFTSWSHVESVGQILASSYFCLVRDFQRHCVHILDHAFDSVWLGLWVVVSSLPLLLLGFYPFPNLCEHFLHKCQEQVEFVCIWFKELWAWQWNLWDIVTLLPEVLWYQGLKVSIKALGTEVDCHIFLYVSNAPSMTRFPHKIC